MNENKGRLGLSLAQQDIYLDQLHKDTSPVYNIGGYMVCRDVDIDRLVAAYQRVLKSHDTFGIRIGDIDGEMFQCVRAERDVDLPIVDFSQQRHPQQSAKAWLEKLFSLPIDVTGSQLYQAWLLKLNDTTYWFVGLAHHIMMDGLGFLNWVRNIADFYNSPVETEYDLAIPSASDNVPASLGWDEVVAGDAQYLKSKRYQTDKAWWATHCKDVDNLGLIPQYPLSSESAHPQTSARYSLEISRDTFSKLTAFAKANDVGIPQVFLGVLAGYFSIVYGKKRLCFGIPAHNRRNHREKACIGVFTGISPLVIEVSAGECFSDLVKRITQQQKANYRHHRYPLGHLIFDLNLSAVEHPVYEIMFNYLNLNESQLAFSGVDAQLVFAENRFLDRPLGINLWDGAGAHLELQFDYHLAYFSEVDIRGLAGRLDNLLSSVLQRPKMLVDEFEVLTPADKRELMRYQHQVENSPLCNATVVDLFEAQVMQTPEAVAAIFDGQALSYGELNLRANKLAGYLKSIHHIEAGSLVGVCMERSLEMLTTIMAILKTGGAYVPIDPQYPASRIAYMLDDAKPATIVTQSDVLTQIADHVFTGNRLSCLCLDDEEVQQSLASFASENLSKGPDANALAYVIYTSGSTGNPKGVMVEHHSLSNFLLSMQKTPGIEAKDCLLAVTSTSFDIHGLELFLPLISGAKLVMASRSATQDPQQLQYLLREYAVSMMQATPSTWKLLLEIDWQPTVPMTLLCGGEVLSQTLATSLLSRENISLWNMYGPTETTIWSSVKQVKPDEQKVLIGRPIANTQFYVVNQELAFVPAGVSGELLIGGQGLARGYLGKTALTQEKFRTVAVPTDDDSQQKGDVSLQRLYRTGDLVRMQHDGHFEYLGRTDQQIKIRGHRIETSEIETALARLGNIKDACVIAKDGPGGERQLAAFIVEKNDLHSSKATSKPPTEHTKNIGFSLFYFGASDAAEKQHYDLYLKAAKFADEHQFDAIWTPERHFDPVGALYPNPSLLSAAVATITNHIALRAGSVVLPLHDPIRVAEEWAMVDNLSHGRAGLAIASGWHPRDFVLSPDNYDSRKQLVREGVQTLKNLWQGKSLQREDGQGNKVDIEVYPKPVQDSLPLWLTAAGNEETFIEAGRLGANLLTHLLGQNLEELTKKIVLYRASLAKHGHDPSAATVTLMIHTSVGEDLTETLNKARQPFLNYMKAHLSLLMPMLKSLNIDTDGLDDSELETIVGFAYERYTQTASLIGTPESCRDVVAKVIDAGVDEIACLIDWMDDESAYAGLPSLNTLAEQSRQLSVNKDLSGELHQHLAGVLPEYMLPASYTALDVLPLTPNGKIDRKGLQALEILPTQTCYLAPNSEVERELVQIWSEVLGLEADSISTNANFFTLGGNSLNATRLTAKISKAFSCSLLIKVIFEKPTIQEQAVAISELTRQKQSGHKQNNHEQLKAAVITPVSLPDHEKQNGYPLSSAQQRLWFLDKLQGKTSDYNMPFEFEVVGELELDLVQVAFSQIIQRHEILRTRFVDVAGSARQQVLEQPEFRVSERDLSHLNGCEAASKLEELRAENRQHLFDISKDMLLTICFIKMPQDADFNGMLLFNMHHIIADGWSVNILLQEFTTLYRSLRDPLKRDPAQLKVIPDLLPHLPIQYKDYACWKRNQVFDTQLGYWQKLLAEAPAQHSLPVRSQTVSQKEDSQQKTPAAKYASFLLNFSKSLSNMLQSTIRETESTLFMILQSTIAVHIGRLSNETDVVVGAPASGRDLADIENLVGFFINTMVFRTEFSHNPSLEDLLRETKKQHLASHAQEIPFEELVGQLNPERNMNSTPIFQILINHDSANVTTMSLPGCELQTCEQGPAPGKYDMTIYIDSHIKDEIRLNWTYNTARFDESTIAMFAAEYEYFLTQVLMKPTMPVLQAGWKTPELSLVEAPKNTTSVREAAKACGNNVISLFDQQVDATPEAMALVFEQKHYSYRQLQTRVDQYAKYLRSVGIDGAGMSSSEEVQKARVAIAISRSDERIVAILAILKLGACYVPLSSELPNERLRLMLEAARPDLLLFDTQNKHLIEHDDVLLDSDVVKQRICIDAPEVASAIHQQSGAPLETVHLPPESEAHIIFTSGSTGKPKGVAGTHGATFNRVQWMLEELPYDHRDPESNENVLHITSMAFIRAVWELLVPLCGGACLHLLPRSAVKDSQQLHDMIVHKNISRLVTTPTLLSVISEQDKHSTNNLPVKHWFVSGEPLLASHVNGLAAKYPELSIYNLYGSTEVMSDVLWYKLQTQDIDTQHLPSAHRQIPLGQPVSGVELLVYADNQVVPKNAVGELIIVGDALSQGYLDASFNHKSFIDTPKGRGYRTGDLVVMTGQGQIYYRGRNDEQIKIRGYRIERNEILQTINQHPQVSASYVKVDGNQGSGNSMGKQRLIAYLVPKADLSISQSSLTQEVKDQLSQQLPDYMVPSAFVCLEAFPLRPNGKINHQQLPPPAVNADFREPPKGVIQTELVKIWDQVLGAKTEAPDINSHFFDLGGHSLMVAKVLRMIEKEFQVTVSYKAFFENSSVKLLARYIEARQSIEAKQSIEARQPVRELPAPVDGKKKKFVI